MTGSVYSFCMSCKVYGDCPAQYNPYQTLLDDEDKTRVNPRGCPNNGRFMELARRKIHGSERKVGDAS